MVLINYVMVNDNVNSTDKTRTVYFDTGTHNYIIINYEYMNKIFNLTAYKSSFSSFSSSNISTYPVILILSNISANTGIYPFYLHSNISASFHYLFFFLCSDSYLFTYLIHGFILFFFFIKYI
jgi:hypothetical protein